MTKRIGRKRRTPEFKEKQKTLALFLFNLAEGAVTTKGATAFSVSTNTIEELKAVGSYQEKVGTETIYRPGDRMYYKNYMADANDILRSNPHLLGLRTREDMGLF